MAQQKYTNGSGVAEIWANIKNYIAAQLLGKSNTGHTHSASDITSGLSTVATSGSYSDLSNKPTIPSNTNQLTNGAGFITSSGSCNYANSAGYVQGNNNSANAANALLRSGSGRTDSSPEGDTWIFVDELGGSGTPWGFKHNQGANTIGFYGAGTETSSINLSNGYFSGSCNYANSAGNSDTLDGYHEYSFLRNRGSTSTSGEGTLWAQIGIKEYYNALPDGLNDVYNYSEVVSLAGTSCRFDIYCSHHSSDGGGLYYRSGWDDDKKAWRCFIDSANIGSQSVNYANSSGNADTVDGSHAWQMQTLAASGVVHGSNDWLMQCQYNVDGDNYFKLICGDRSIGTKVDRASSAGYADTAGSVAWANVSDKPTIPTKTSDLTNDSGFITSVDTTALGSLASNSIPFHNAYPRCKYLGNSITDAQNTAIKNRTYDDLFIGDYWTINDVNWRIVAIDYYYNVGDTNFDKGNVIVMPDTVLYNAQMNSVSTTYGAYAGSLMRKQNLNNARTIAQNAFGSHLASHRIRLANTSWGWYDSDGVELPNEVQIYGTRIWGSALKGYDVASQKQQFPLMLFAPQFVNIRQDYWLQDTSSSSSSYSDDFAAVSSNGDADAYSASKSFGVRPCVTLSYI